MARSNVGFHRVLVVDDMKTPRWLISNSLPTDEFEVIEADSGLAALEVIKNTQVDAVVMDIMMPDMDGIEVTKYIRNKLELKLLPIIIVTSVEDTQRISNALEAGANDYVKKPFNIVELIARIKTNVKYKHLTDRLDDTESVLFSLARMVEARDEGTSDHCDRLSYMSVVFGREMGLSFNELEALRKGGVLHDIGKLGIPDRILLKNGKLEGEDWEIMKTHVDIGVRLCEPLRTMRDTVDIIACHHERWNGSGYPNQLSKEKIPLLARIFQVCDIFDALRSERPYKRSFCFDDTKKIMNAEAAEGKLDPKLVNEFLKIAQSTFNSSFTSSENEIEHLYGINVESWYPT